MPAAPHCGQCDGVAVCTAAGDQYEVGIISDGSDGAIISWRDDRNGGSNPDIYAQRVDPLGNALWTAGGAAVCTEPHTQCSPRITTDGFGGAVITWMDDRDETWNVYAQRIDAGGVLQWGTNGNPVSTAASDQQNPAIISHTDGSSIIAWEDFRSGFDFDIYAIRFGDEGVGTLLQSHSATLDGTDVSITWILEDIDPGARFHVLRARGPEWVFHPLDQAALVRDGLTYRFTDTACEAGTTCRYRVDVCDGQGRWTLFETGSIAIPTAPAALYQNRPNPFNPVTSIGYYLPGRCHVTLDIFDPSGRLVVRLVERTEGAGRHEIEWNGLDRNGNTAASGLYLYRLTAGKERISRKMILLR